MLENNKWYKSQHGSVYFKTGIRKGFGFSHFMLPGGLRWYKSDSMNFKTEGLWREITSIEEVLVAINKGMKSIGYNNNVLIKPIISQSEKPINLKDYHFDFKNGTAFDLLLNHGELWLKRNNLKGERYICVLRGGNFSKIVKRYDD